MREIVLDTETTGLDPAEGHRIVEIGAIEIVNYLPTGAVFHRYINPEMAMPLEAFQVHGLGDDFLRRQPLFTDIVKELLEFLGDSSLVIHNAEFDRRMLNAELNRMMLEPIPAERTVDTVKIARQRFPGAPVSLDALCRRFGVDNARRTKHGALLDCELLAEVYLELCGGRQGGLQLIDGAGSEGGRRSKDPVAPRPRPLRPRLTQAERIAHAACIAELGDGTLWPRDQEPT